MSLCDESCDSKLPEEDLIRFILHENSFDKSSDVREHLLRCGPCQERIDGLRESMVNPATLSSTRTIEHLTQSDEAFHRESLFDTDDEDNVGLQNRSDLSNPSTNKRFERRGLLGRGGYGSVYRAFDHKLGREVAVKIPHRSIVGEDGERRRFKREVEATARLRHPYIVALHDFVLTKNESFLIHEIIEGETLEAWISRQPEGCDPRMAAEIVLRIAQAVSYAYDQRILHRDIKPSNILLDIQRADSELPFHPRLADFGVAKIIRNETLRRRSELSYPVLLLLWGWIS